MMHSAACRQARTSLEAAFAASRRDRDAHAAELKQARKAAERACLGGNGVAQTPERLAPDPPLVAPPIRATPPSTVRALPPVTVAPPPPVAAPQPRVLNTCDATGCFDNNGTRLQQNGPMLSGPNGLCSVQGTFVTCP